MTSPGPAGGSTSPAHEWDESYSGQGSPAPWDIGRPQPAFARLAEAGALTGALLDAGCGTGEHTILAAACGARALGVDLSTRAIAIARRKAAERNADARFEVLDVLELAGRQRGAEEGGEPDGGEPGLGEPPFDTVLDSGLFHVFDPAGARGRYVAALHAVLVPGGHLHLMCFSDRQPGDWGPRRVSDAELRAAFASGWRVESLVRERFELNPVMGTESAEAWLADIVRLGSPR